MWTQGTITYNSIFTNHVLITILTKFFCLFVSVSQLTHLSMDRLLRLGGGMPGLGQVT